MHKFQVILSKKVKSPEEEVLCAAICFISTREPYSHLTMEGVFDKLQNNWKEISTEESLPSSK